MSNVIKYDQFEIIDIHGALKASKSVSEDIRDLKNTECINYKETQNGFVIVLAQEETNTNNRHALNIVRKSVIDYFDKTTLNEPLIAIRNAIIFANKKLYFSATHNESLKGVKISCLIVLIREKQIFYSYVGNNNLFILKNGTVKRLTPGRTQTTTDELAETDLINSSLIDLDINISICDRPVNPNTNDYLIVCANEYVKYSDDFIVNTLVSENNLEQKSLEILNNSYENRVEKSKSFLIVRFDIKGGPFSEMGSTEFMYNNILDRIIEYITSNLVLLIMAALIVIILFFYLI